MVDQPTNQRGSMLPVLKKPQAKVQKSQPNLANVKTVSDMDSNANVDQVHKRLTLKDFSEGLQVQAESGKDKLADDLNDTIDHINKLILDQPASTPTTTPVKTTAKATKAAAAAVGKAKAKAQPTEPDPLDKDVDEYLQQLTKRIHVDPTLRGHVERAAFGRALYNEAAEIYTSRATGKESEYWLSNGVSDDVKAEATGMIVVANSIKAGAAESGVYKDLKDYAFYPKQPSDKMESKFSAALDKLVLLKQRKYNDDMEKKNKKKKVAVEAEVEATDTEKQQNETQNGGQNITLKVVGGGGGGEEEQQSFPPKHVSSGQAANQHHSDERDAEVPDSEAEEEIVKSTSKGAMNDAMEGVQGSSLEEGVQVVEELPMQKSNGDAPSIEDQMDIDNIDTVNSTVNHQQHNSNLGKRSRNGTGGPDSPTNYPELKHFKADPENGLAVKGKEDYTLEQIQKKSGAGSEVDGDTEEDLEDGEVIE